MKSRLNLVIRQKIFGVLFIAAAVLLGVLMFYYIHAIKSDTTENRHMQQLVIASRDIDAGMVLEKDMLEAQHVPQAVFSDRAIKDAEEIIGKEVSRHIHKGEIIYGEHVAGYQERSFSGLSSHIPRGMRAVTMPVTFYGSEGLLQVGESVDLISTYYSQEHGDMVAITILEQKEVILIGTRSEDHQQAGLLAAEGIRNEAVSQNLLTVTLYLSPAEAETVFQAAQRGIINIAICPYRPFNY